MKGFEKWLSAPELSVRLKTIFISLLVLGAFFNQTSATAQSTVTTQWSYAGTNYPTQAAAVAAMQAAKPQNSIVTMMAGVTNMAANKAQYKYIAPPQSPSRGAE